MKNKFYKIFTLIVLLGMAIPANAQLYEILNQVPQMITPALSGSLRYRGVVDVSYTKGVGRYNADFIDISTSQGFQYSDWFFMGVGLGVGGVFTHPSSDWGEGWNGSPTYNDRYYGSSATNCVMLPVFTDFRFNIGSGNGVAFQAGVKLGCLFLAGNKYLRINNGYLTQNEYFYFKPTLGVRIPINPTQHPKRAINVGFSYQLLTSNYWYGPSSNATINSFGATIGYEW